MVASQKRNISCLSFQFVSCNDHNHDSKIHSTKLRDRQRKADDTIEATWKIPSYRIAEVEHAVGEGVSIGVYTGLAKSIIASELCKNGCCGGR